MAMTYNSFVTSLANMIVVPETDPYFQQILPTIIQDAEGRLYRELDMLATRTADDTLVMVAGTFAYSLPTLPSGDYFIVVETVNVVTPAGGTVANGKLNPLSPASKEMIFALYPDTQGAGVPKYFAMTHQNSFIVGPRPDAAYRVQITGTYRPIPFSGSNAETPLTMYLPDVFLAAAMVMATGYQKNFTSMGDDPKAAVSWESHVQVLLTSARVEEFRKRFGSEGWTSKTPDPIASPPRT